MPIGQNFFIMFWLVDGVWRALFKASDWSELCLVTLQLSTRSRRSTSNHINYSHRCIVVFGESFWLVRALTSHATTDSTEKEQASTNIKYSLMYTVYSINSPNSPFLCCTEYTVPHTPSIMYHLPYLLFVHTSNSLAPVAITLHTLIRYHM